MSDFSEGSLRELLTAIESRTALFINHKFKDTMLYKERPIYLRFDIDDDLRKAVKMANICYDYNISATFFILNTAKYWHSQGLMNELKFMQDSLGHEIGWHNNVLTEWLQSPPDAQHMGLLNHAIDRTLSYFRTNGIIIRGSASHGDQLCHKLGYLNYEVFKECPRTEEATNFPKPSFTIPQVSMYDFGLEYEAYHVPYDLYLSESGGRAWSGRANGTAFKWRIDELNLSLLDKHNRIQILIHPQHWKI